MDREIAQYGHSPLGTMQVVTVGLPILQYSQPHATERLSLTKSPRALERRKFACSIVWALSITYLGVADCQLSSRCPRSGLALYAVYQKKNIPVRMYYISTVGGSILIALQRSRNEIKHLLSKAYRS
jgi:hypothetical protein